MSAVLCGEWRDQGLAKLLSRVIHVVSAPVLSGVPGATFAEMDRKRSSVSLSTISDAQAPAQRSGATTMSARVQSSATAWACRLQATLRPSGSRAVASGRAAKLLQHQAGIVGLAVVAIPAQPLLHPE